MTSTADAIGQLMATCTREALHLEMRDEYEADRSLLSDWRAGRPFVRNEGNETWARLISQAVARGVTVRRARIISEPASEYIHYEHWLTSAHNVSAGEQVRWLPRRRSADVMLPGTDFWLFDASTVIFNHFSGSGRWHQLPLDRREDDDLTVRCHESFETVWSRSVPHEEYRLE